MDYRFDTKCIQSGYQAENGAPRTLPICQSTTFQYDDADALGLLFDLKAEGICIPAFPTHRRGGGG